MSLFKPATRKKVYLKLGLMGPSGSGKTYSALLLAKGLAEGGNIALLDTENGSASLYAGTVAKFDVVDMGPPFTSKKVLSVIDEAVEAGYKVLVIDSITHFWKQILADKEILDGNGGNSYANWGKVKPKFEEFKNKLLQAPIHIVCCMRAKDEYVLESDAKGKSSPKKVGMGAIMEPGAEYEFTTVFEIGMDHNAIASKDRTTMFADEYAKITEKTGERFMDWMNSGEGEGPTVLATPANEDQFITNLDKAKTFSLNAEVTAELKGKLPAEVKLSDWLAARYDEGLKHIAELYQYLNDNPTKKGGRANAA
jgi:hypothetical protein